MDKLELRVLLHKQERSQRFLARRLNVSYQSVYKWATGKMPISKTRATQIRRILS